MNFTIAFIEHNKDVYFKYLKPSLDNLKGNFEVISISDKLFPAENYNKLIESSNNDWIILTHQDISFPPNLLEKIELTINKIGEQNIGALCKVGVDVSGEYRFSTSKEIYEVQTSDCCFLVINKKNNILYIRFSYACIVLSENSIIGTSPFRGKHIFHSSDVIVMLILS